MARFHRKVVAKPTAASKNGQLWPVPLPNRDPLMELSDLIGASEVAAIQKQGQLQFQATGDTGVGMNSQEPVVADAMAKEINVAKPAVGPTFLLILGDIIYGNNKRTLYSDRFYQPEMSYLHPAPGFDGMILAIPGNHDGEVRVPADQPSLSATGKIFAHPWVPTHRCRKRSTWSCPINPARTGTWTLPFSIWSDFTPIRVRSSASWARTTRTRIKAIGSCRP